MSETPFNPHGIRHGALSQATVHVCVDMQRLFSEETDWKTPWMARVLPNVLRLVATHPDKNVFTRFMPASRAGDGVGVWKRYWTRWANMTLEALPARMTELLPELARHADKAAVVDKHVYSPWLEGALERELQHRQADTLIISGCETDVCVLATVLGAVDRGYRVIVVTDAICSSTDATHDALMTLYEQRYTEQVETIDTGALLVAWR